MNLISVETAVTPTNPITFLLDWELTMKCNLDCTYCDVGIYGGHDNSTKHPKFNDCVKTLKFLFEYADLYMDTKKSKNKLVILNVYGGESLHHPDIVKILAEAKNLQTPYKEKWHLTVTTTTNAIVKDSKFAEISKYIDQFTFSYHTESAQKQKEQFKRNALFLKEQNIPLKCVILMNPLDKYFEDALSMVNWCKENNINHLPRQLDNPESHFYKKHQIVWFNTFYNTKTFNESIELELPESDSRLRDQGRACCAGRQLCVNKEYKNRHFYIPHQFKDWYCSVNEYFVFVKQVNGEIYTNRDCKMNFNGRAAPIGHLDRTEELLEFTRSNLKSGTMPIIQCKKNDCLCGLCAPKAKDLDEYKTIMLKYKHEK